MTAQIPVSSDFVASIPREHIPAVIAALVARLLVEPELASPAAPSSAPATQDEGPMLTPDEAATVLRRKGMTPAKINHELAMAKRTAEAIRPVLEVGYITGWRITSDILTRQKRHVDLEAGWLRLDPGESKNGEGRMFPLTPEL